MRDAIASMLFGATLFWLAASALTVQIDRLAIGRRVSERMLLSLAFVGLSALALFVLGDYALDRSAHVGVLTAAAAASGLGLTLVIGCVLILLPERPLRGDSGAPEPDDLPPPPDPDGPDGWAAFERDFRSTAAQADCRLPAGYG